MSDILIFAQSEAAPDSAVLAGVLLFYQILGIMIGTAIGGIILWKAVNKVCSNDFPIALGFGYMFMMLLLDNSISAILMMLFGRSLDVNSALGFLIFLYAGLFIINAVFLGTMVRDKKGKTVGVGNGFLIEVMMIALYICVIICIAILVAGLMFVVTLIGMAASVANS